MAQKTPPKVVQDNSNSDNLKSLDEKIKQLKLDSSGMGNLDESGLLEYSMEMQNQFKGLLNNADESILNESLNSSKMGGHRRQYSTDQSVLFGKDYLNDTLNQSQNEGDTSKDINTSNFLNLKDLFMDTTKQMDDSPDFDPAEQEKEFRDLFDNNKVDNQENDDEENEDEDDVDEEVKTTSPKNVFGNDTESLSDNSNGRPQTPESAGKGAFNPFKTPVVPGAVGWLGKKKSDKAKSITSEENRSQTGEIKFVSDQYSEWNKRISKALTDESYYGDGPNKSQKRAPRNPLDKLTIENMKDNDRTSETSKKFPRPIPSKETMKHNTLQVAGSENKKANNTDPKSLFVSFNVEERTDQETDTSKIENGKLIKDILKVEIILVLINTDIVSDFELNRSKKYLKDFINNNPECSEAHYGLSQVYFSLGLYNRALEEINIALELNKSDTQFLTWKALYLYYLFKNLLDSSKKIDALRKCEETCKKILLTERRNLFPLYLLFILMLEVNKCKAEGTKISSNTTKKPEDYAKRILEINEYLGEMWYAELQLVDPKKTALGREKLLEIVEDYPTYPHAFIRLCMHDYYDMEFSNALETIEQLYNNYESFHTIPELETWVTLLYAKLLFKDTQFIKCFETLQQAFWKNPTFTVYLFELGRCEVSSELKNFRGSAVGILQECIRSWVSQRKADINYYLGAVYKKLHQPMKAFEYFQTSYQLFKDKTYHPYGCPDDKKKTIKSFIEEFYDINKFEFIIRRKAKSVQQALKENKDVQIKENTLESLISAWNALIRADKYNGAVLRGVIAWEIEMDKKQAITVYEKILCKYPDNMEAYFHYWELLRKIGDKQKMEKISIDMMKAAGSTSVPTPEWMKVHSLRAKTLIMNEKFEEAILILKKQVHIIPPLAIPGLSYLKDGAIIEDEVVKESESPFESSSDAQDISENDVLPDGYKFSVGRSSKPQKFKDNSTVPAADEQTNTRSINPWKLDSKSNESHRFSFNVSEPEGIDLTKKHNRAESADFKLKNKKVTEIHHPIEGFSVSTDVDFLYQIGKICAENGIKIEEGIKSLNDFCLILDYYNQDMDVKTYTKMKTLAKFYIGVCYFRQKDIDSTEIVMRGILGDLKEVEGKTGARFKEVQKILTKCFKERLLYEVELFDNYFYPVI